MIKETCCNGCPRSASLLFLCIHALGTKPRATLYDRGRSPALRDLGAPHVTVSEDRWKDSVVGTTDRGWSPRTPTSFRPETVSRRVKRRLRRRGRRHRCWKWRESKHTPCFFSEAQPKWRLCFWHSQNTQRASAWLKNVANSSSYKIKMVQFMTLKKKAKHIKLLRVLFIFIDSYRRMFMRVPILLEENY